MEGLLYIFGGRGRVLRIAFNRAEVSANDETDMGMRAWCRVGGGNDVRGAGAVGRREAADAGDE